MPFIPHTPNDEKTMLEAMGENHIDNLFDEIPSELKIDNLLGIGESLSEMQLNQVIQAQARKIRNYDCYLGAGAYEHYIPAAVWDIANRGEFLTAYTPYQPEANQGALQVIWEYQTMMASLMSMDISNASLYDGATALSEAALMALRCQTKHHSTIWVLATTHPFYREVLKTILKPQNIQVIEIPFDQANGMVSIAALEQQWLENPQCDALIIPFPNFFGQFEKVHELTDWAHSKEALVIACVNPLAMGWLTPPGTWGGKGADLACGEGQPLGIPLMGGGPYFGFLTARKKWVRQMPGRIVGATHDSSGKPAFTLTLQTREQHIRREKATSNICTNQGLTVTAATIYMSLMGPQGLLATAQRCYALTLYLKNALQAAGLNILFSKNHFHEIVVQLPLPVATVITRMQTQGFLAGFDLSSYYPLLGNALLVCVTETKSEVQINNYVTTLIECLHEHF